MIRSLDHFVHIVNDLEASSALFKRLGFHVRPIAHHIEVGSSNCVIHFANTYMELIDITNAIEDMKAPYVDRFKCGEGMAHVSLTSSDLVADHAWAEKEGLTDLPIWSARRKITRPDGSPDETASDFFYMWREESRYMSLFLSHHKKPEAIFIKAFEDHANTAIDLTKIVYMSTKIDQDIPYFTKLYGKSPDERSDDGFTMIGARGDVTQIMSPAAFTAAYGKHAPCASPEPLAGFVAANHYTVRSSDACRKVLQDNAIPFEAVGDQTFVSADQAGGCAIVFEGAPLS